MFKKSNAFFTRIVDAIGKLLAPHKLFWSCAFGVWAVLAPLLVSMKLVPYSILSVWLWSLPFMGIYAVTILLGHFGFFSRPEHQDNVKEMERLRAQRKQGERNVSTDQEEKIRQMDKTRPDRR